MTSPKPFTQLFLDQAANLTGRHQHVNKQLGGKSCPPGNYLLALLQGREQADKKKSLTPEHMPTSSKEIPQPQAINHFPETPRPAGLYTDLHQEEGLLGSSPPLQMNTQVEGSSPWRVQSYNQHRNFGKAVSAYHPLRSELEGTSNCKRVVLTDASTNQLDFKWSWEILQGISPPTHPQVTRDLYEEASLKESLKGVWNLIPPSASLTGQFSSQDRINSSNVLLF